MPGLRISSCAETDSNALSDYVWFVLNARWKITITVPPKNNGFPPSDYEERCAAIPARPGPSPSAHRADAANTGAASLPIIANYGTIQFIALQRDFIADLWEEVRR